MKAARVYAKLGWAVIPDEPMGKRPILSNWPELATSDTATVEGWIEEYPAANIGIATGSKSGFWVLDVDPDKGGAETLAALVAKHGPLPHTVQAQTGSGGSHYLFTMPEGQTITNSAGKLGPGLDVRGDGGQIVVAPSITAKGSYRWVNAPWATPVAAGGWLLTMLRPRYETSVDPRESVRFVSASPAVLEQAAAALERHGPATEGSGGDAHTFIACALLSHDFALTEQEAWPLLVEWNETCDPPWSEDDLRAKLKGASKYATGPMGAKRTADSRDRANALITSFEDAPGGDPVALCVALRKLPFTDSAARAIVEGQAKQATGLSVKAIALPPIVRAAPEKALPQGSIHVTAQIAAVADQAIVTLAPHTFQRAGLLCEVVTNDATRISDLETARVVDLMSSSARYMRTDDKGLVEQVAPLVVAQILHARRCHPSEIRTIESVTTAPIFLADGSILQERGYSEQARVYLEPSVTVSVPDQPTQADARAAVALFRDLLSDCRFLEPADFSTWVAALLSPLVKSATKCAPAPLFCVSAAAPGAGKTLLTSVLARIVTGTAPEVRPYNPKDPSEWGKRLTAYVKAASPVSVFDNVNGPMGDESLDRLLTSTTWSDRILGASEAPPLPVVSTWIATGNNIEPCGDTIRRCAFIRIDVHEERPQERTGFAHADLEDYVDGARAELLGAALTILRAYHCAGRPAMGLASWGSFGAWSALVRGAIVWAGLVDPMQTQQRAQIDLNETDHEAHDFWLDVVDTCDGTSGSIAVSANQRNGREVLGLRDEISAHGLKKLLHRFVDRVRGKQRIRRDRVADGPPRYYVETISG